MRKLTNRLSERISRVKMGTAEVNEVDVNVILIHFILAELKHLQKCARIAVLAEVEKKRNDVSQGWLVGRCARIWVRA